MYLFYLLNEEGRRKNITKYRSIEKIQKMKIPFEYISKTNLKEIVTCHPRGFDYITVGFKFKEKVVEDVFKVEDSYIAKKEYLGNEREMAVLKVLRSAYKEVEPVEFELSNDIKDYCAMKHSNILEFDDVMDQMSLLRLEYNRLMSIKNECCSSEYFDIEVEDEIQAMN